MSGRNAATPSPDDDVPNEPNEIQFEHAEFMTPFASGPTCGVCRRPILNSYYEISSGPSAICSICCQSGTSTADGPFAA